MRCLARSPTSLLSNLSTRGFGEGDDVIIEGNIVGGTSPRRVLISGVGPDLADLGVAGALANPTLMLFEGQTALTSNDDWRTSPDRDAIIATGKAPNHDRESAILRTLNPGAYTAILSGVNNGTGIGLVQAFDVGTGAGKITNISTRVQVGTGDRVMIGGFIVGEGADKRVLIRGLGPTLGAAPFNVPGALANPEMRLFSGATEIANNADWTASPDKDAIYATDLAPPRSVEPAILRTLAPGAYTAVVFGTGGTSGVALVEVYELP